MRNLKCPTQRFSFRRAKWEDNIKIDLTKIGDKDGFKYYLYTKNIRSNISARGSTKCCKLSRK
jgi:hypothetical protein